MTQEMADIIGAAAGDPGCRMMTTVLEEDNPKAYAAEMFHCLEQGYVVRMDATGAIQATGHGITARRAAIAAAEVRA